MRLAHEYLQITPDQHILGQTVATLGAYQDLRRGLRLISVRSRRVSICWCTAPGSLDTSLYYAARARARSRRA
jgi:hypothetical protein